MIVTLRTDYFDVPPGDRAPKRRYRSEEKEGGYKHSNTNIRFSLGHQTKGGLDAVAQPPSPNVSNFGIAHHIPGGTMMTTYSPREELPRPRTLAGQKPPPTP